MDMKYRFGMRSSRNDRPAPPADTVITRAASYTYIRDAKVSTFSSTKLVTITGEYECDTDSVSIADDPTDASPSESSGYSTPDEGLEIKSLQDGSHVVLLPESDDSAPILALADAAQEPDAEHSSIDSSVDRASLTSLDSINTVSTTASSIHLPRPRPSITNSYSRLTRRSWCESLPSRSASSRSPSPVKQTIEIPPPPPPPEPEPELTPTAAVARPPAAHSRKKSLIRRRSFGVFKESRPQLKNENPTIQENENENSKPPGRRASMLRAKPRPVSAFFRTSAKNPKGADAEPASPADLTAPRVATFPLSFSTDKLPSYRSPATERAAPPPRLLSSERVPTINTVTRKRDELWNVFRTLDADFAKFASKSTALKANVVRSGLLPFLRTYSKHSTTEPLRLEDLDRRANILNKWWTGLIDMLHGRNNQSISGTDRPAVLDAISGIMERPEWRMPPSPFCPSREGVVDVSPSKVQPHLSSIDSNTPDYLAQSVQHNVRNIFVQNLSAQMAFVVDKMSLRHASASLVTFCGKACAYAFMFVPGMADVLVRLWDLQMPLLQRVLCENGIQKFDDMTSVSTNVMANFPPALHKLTFSSLTKFIRKLRTPPPLPLGTAHIEWWGHWLERWTGRESDLFYVFAKHYYFLATEFISPSCSSMERLCAPGMLPVQAQLLASLDATLHKVQAPVHPDLLMNGPPGTLPSLDQIMTDADAVAPALPIPPPEPARSMAEHRLIMLLRDVLSGRAAETAIARQMFAISFSALLHAAAKAVSVFDHLACFSLLDFLEEALLILVRYERLQEMTLIDVDFWRGVFRTMLTSQNTTTEIRLYSFLFTVWATLTSSEERKTRLCLDFLLDPAVFESQFNHWCPMVRAYYMRLLCWRVGRFDGDETSEGNDHDETVLEVLLERLQTSWSHYLYLKEQAEMFQTVAPVLTPCSPAPNRRLLIVRMDTLPMVNTFLSFDGIVSPYGHGHSPTPSLHQGNSRPGSSQSMSDSDGMDSRDKGLIAGFLRKIMGGSPSKDREIGETTTNIVNDKHGRDQIVRKNRFSSQPPNKFTVHDNYCFRFSLEYCPNTRPTTYPTRLQAPRLPLPAQLFLQSRSSRARAVNAIEAVEPLGQSRVYARYAGRALAEWNLILGECHGFFERRKHEGVPSNRFVETPALAVEVVRRSA